MIELGDALRILGISEPGDDLLYTIETLNELIHGNEHYRAEGRSDLVDEDYGLDLNTLADRLGVSSKGRLLEAARVDSDLRELVVGTSLLSGTLVILPASRCRASRGVVLGPGFFDLGRTARELQRRDLQAGSGPGRLRLA